MKKTFIFVFTMLSLSLFVFSQVKIGVINAQEILQKTKKGVTIQKKLEGLQKKKQTEIEKLQNEIKTLSKDLGVPALSAEAREKKGRQLEDKKITYNRVLQDAQKEMQMKSQQELMNLQKEILPIIAELGKAKGYTLVLDMASSGIAYFDQGIDITAEVIKAVDAKYPGK
ncbi:MAG: OmpH family outer membrane protein [bacterium]|nr:OmpH family outer membrane protein [bacterium]